MKKDNENVEDQMDADLTEKMGKNKKNVKKKSKKKVIIIIIVAAVILFVIAIAGMISSVSKNMQAAMEEMAGENETVFKVEKQDVEQEITTSGTVIGTEKNAYVSPVTAKVEDIRVEVGQMVKKGDVLLTYDASELGDNLEKVKIQAQSERAAGNESYEMASEAASKTSAAQKKVKKLKSDIKKLKKEIETLSDKVSEYENQIKEAEDAAAAGEAEDIKTVDETAYNKAVKKLNEKNESLASKQAQLSEQESIVAANKDVKVSDSTKAQISAANQLSDMNINDAQDSLDAAEAGITASKDGIVESIEIVKGAYANETQTLVTVIDADKIGVEFSISKDDLGSITTGQKARVVIAGNEYEGNVDFISKVAISDAAMASASSSGGTIKGRIVIENPDENIFIGVAAKVYIFVGKSEQALVIPYEALNTDIDGDYVYIVNGNNLIERRDVTLGIYSDEYYEVIDGLKEGDRVITDVTSDMKPGEVYVGNAAEVMTE